LAILEEARSDDHECNDTRRELLVSSSSLLAVGLDSLDDVQIALLSWVAFLIDIGPDVEGFGDESFDFLTIRDERVGQDEFEAFCSARQHCLRDLQVGQGHFAFVVDRVLRGNGGHEYFALFFSQLLVADQFDQDVVTALRGIVNSQQIDGKDVELFNLMSSGAYDHGHALAFLLGQVTLFGREILFDL